MSHAPYTPEEYKKNVSKIWRTTAILSVVTIVEVIIAVGFDLPYWLLALIVSVISLIKATYIMGVFMHLGQETRGFKFAVLFPFVLLTWGFLSFSLEGLSTSGMRDAINTILMNWSF